MFFTLSHNLSVRTSVECMCNVYKKINVPKDFGDRGKPQRPYRTDCTVIWLEASKSNP